MRKIAGILKNEKGFPISYVRLLDALKNKCGDKAVVKYKDCEPIEFVIPRILDDDVIAAVRDRVSRNKTWDHRNGKRFSYLLSGYVRCFECGKSLVGHAATNKKYKYRYYRHQGNATETCTHMTMVKADKLEQAVMTAVFDNVGDQAGFDRAIRDSLPDAAYIRGLKKDLVDKRNGLVKIDQGLENLVDAVISGTLEHDVVADSQEKLLKRKAELTDTIEQLDRKLVSLPTAKAVKIKADLIRAHLLDYFGSTARLEDMAFDDKRLLIESLFSGTMDNGLPLGVYIEKTGKRKWKFYVVAQLLNLVSNGSDNWEKFVYDNDCRGKSARI